MRRGSACSKARTSLAVTGVSADRRRPTCRRPPTSRAWTADPAGGPRPHRPGRAAGPRPPRQPPAGDRGPVPGQPRAPGHRQRSDGEEGLEGGATAGARPRTLAGWLTGSREVEAAFGGCAVKPQLRVPVPEPSHLTDEAIKARIAVCSGTPGRPSRARGRPAPGPAHRRHGLPGQGDPGPGRRRSADRRGRRRRASRDDPRPQDRGSPAGAWPGGAGGASPAAAARDRQGRRGSSVSSRGTSSSRTRARGRGAGAPAGRPSPTSSTARPASPSTTPTRTRSARTCCGCLNALGFSLGCSRRPGSPLRRARGHRDLVHPRPASKRLVAQEGTLVFPRHFYNNFYELTKAMASIETDRFMIEKGLRVVQLLPSIVIGHSRTGNNRGDTKVVNAPINAFGRAKEAARVASRATSRQRRPGPVGPVAHELPRRPVGRAEPRARRPGRPRGSWRPCRRPRPSASRIHLATDNRIRSRGHDAHHPRGARRQRALSDPTLFRNVTLPVVKASLTPDRRDEARRRAREAGHDLRRLRGVGPADPRGRQRRARSWACPCRGRTPRSLPHAVPAQSLRPGVTGRCATRTRSRAASVWDGRHRRHRVRHRPSGGVARRARSSGACG